MIKVVIFDLWNTLIPTTIDWPLVFSLVKKNNPNNKDVHVGDFIRRYEELTQLKKYPTFEVFRKDFVEGFDGDALLLEQELCEIFVNRLDKIHFFKDTLPALKKLKKDGYKLALLTNTENLAFEKVDSILSISKYFDYLGLSYEINAVKPDKRMFLSVVNNFKVNPSECLMIGDSLRSDITGAKNVGMHQAWINRPGRSYDLAKITPEFELNTLKDIDKVLGVLNAKRD
jgi:2-haloalkanoic acid dehalogenase type II